MWADGLGLIGRSPQLPPKAKFASTSLPLSRLTVRAGMP